MSGGEDQAGKTGIKKSSTGGGGGEPNKDDLGGNKDDLTGSRTVLEESMDSEVSLRHETPCQPRVMEHREDDSTKSGCQVPDRGQEEEYNNPSVSPRTIDLGCGTTSGQSNVIRTNELTEGGTFVVEEELEWRGESDGVRDGLDWRRNTLLGGVQEELATRPDAGGVDEEPSGSSMSSMPEPSMGVKYSAEKGIRMT